MFNEVLLHIFITYVSTVNTARFKISLRGRRTDIDCLRQWRHLN